jgi:hypothetical protein
MQREGTRRERAIKGAASTDFGELASKMKNTTLQNSTILRKTTTFWMQQLRFAQANLDYLKYSTGQPNIDAKRLRTLIKTQESQMKQCEWAIQAEDSKAARAAR